MLYTSSIRRIFLFVLHVALAQINVFVCVIVECEIRIVKMWHLESDYNSHAQNDTAVETHVLNMTKIAQVANKLIHVDLTC
jgi:hypothetical protein